MSGLLRGFSMVALAIVAWSAVASAAPTWTVTIKGGESSTLEVIVSTDLSIPIPPGAYSLTLQGGGNPLPAQVITDNGQTSLTVIVPSSLTGTALTGTLAPIAPTKTGVEIFPDGKNLSVTVGGQPLTTYLIDAGPKPYYFPLYGPTGALYTRSFPMKDIEGEKRDHPHQRSFWFTHGKVNNIDFWSEVPNHGNIRETRRYAVVSGPALGLIRTADDWLGPDGSTILTDERTVRFYATKTSRVIDFDIVLAATVGDVTFGDTKEGMLGVRVPTSMDVSSKKGGKITNSEGQIDLKAWGQPAPWVDYTGPVDGKTVGIAILNGPGSFRYPTTWHVRDYGLFAANPFGYKDFGRKESGDYTIPKGESIGFRYRLILHEGETEKAGIRNAYTTYAKPPQVTVKAD